MYIQHLKKKSNVIISIVIIKNYLDKKNLGYSFLFIIFYRIKKLVNKMSLKKTKNEISTKLIIKWS